MKHTLALLAALVLLTAAACNRSPSIDESVAQVERIRSGLTVTTAQGHAEPVSTLRRVSRNELVRTDGTGRAVLALDGGGRYVLDREAAVRVGGPRAATLEAGRIWVAGGGEGGREERTDLRVGDTTLHLRGARAGIERRANGGAQVTVLAGEIAYESSRDRGAIRAGESGEIAPDARVTLGAQPLFADWTGGLADDLPAGTSDAAGLGAVAARRPEEVGAPRWPMVMQRLDAHVVVRGDLAITTLDQTFFNPSADTVEGLYTFHTPPGAVLQMFGVDRRGRTVEGVVRERQQAAAHYQEQVYQGSTHDPALLEWDAPGRYHARLYPIPPGATRRVRVRYSQWLAPDTQGHRVYRLPLASLETRVGELHADFDLDEARVTQVRAGTGARVEDNHLYITQSDVIPRADMVVELAGARAGDVTATRVSAPSGGDDHAGNFLRVAVRAPFDAAREPRDEGVDLVIVVDHSAATDALALRLEQAFVESLVNNLDARDQVLVLAGDVATRPVGSPAAELRAATPENRRAIIDALTHDPLGGATDLGAMVAAAHAALRPGRNGAIVYVGDGNATVGEAQLPGLRRVLARLSPRPRFYAVAVGEDPRLDVLSGLAAPAGFAARVARRGDVARTALELVEHASRPLVRNFRVTLGPQVTAVYPTEPVDVPAGEPLVVVGRFTTEPPRSVQVRASWNGNEVTRTVPLETGSVDDGGDLRFRWANARLEHLLARGESRPVIVELGTRYGLITPFTSLYVPSEDEVSRLDEQRARDEQRVAATELADLSVFDLLPLVGCTRSRHAPRARAPEEETLRAGRFEQQEGGTGTRHAGAEGRMGRRDAPARSARYAIRSNGEPPHLSRQASREAVANRGVFAALGTPGGGGSADDNDGTPAADTPPAPPPAAPSSGVVSPFGGLTESGADNANANGNITGDSIGDAFGYGGLGATGTGWGGGGTGGGGTGEGTIGLGNVGTTGHGSGQGYGSGAGRGLRGRGTTGPLVRAAPPSVTGLLSPEAIRRVVLRNLGQVAHCHEQGLAQNPNSEGRVVVRFIIGGNGQVMGANAVESSVPVPSVAQCVAGAVRRWQFPSPEGGGIVTVNYPFNLQAPEGGGGGSSGETSAPAPPPRREPTLVRLGSPVVEGGLGTDAVRRVIAGNVAQFASCQQQGLAEVPGSGGHVVVRFVIEPNGEVESAEVVENAAPVSSVADCIADVIDGLHFAPPRGGAYATARYPFELLPGDGTAGVRTVARARAPQRCSDAASVPLGEREALWQERVAQAGGAAALAQVYRAAGNACELRTWADRVALLRLMVGRASGVDSQIALYRALRSDPAARTWTRDVILRALARSGELARAQELGLGRLDPDTMTVALGRAATPAQRLAVFAELARRYPDDLDLGQRMLEYAVEQRNADAVRLEAARLRVHPEADQRVRTAVGEALLAIGDEAEARRAFSEIVEFAPDDPAARRRLGDIALSHGWADEAYRQFAMLAVLADDAPDVLLRQAMAARMAGRLDEAVRLAERVAEQSSGGGAGAWTPPRGGLWPPHPRSGVAETAAAWIGATLALASHEDGVPPEALEALRARWRRSPAARAAGAVRAIVQWTHPDDGAELWVTLPDEPARRADLVSSAIFLETNVLTEAPANNAPVVFEVRRGTTARPHGRVELIVIWGEGTDHERVARQAIDLDEQHATHVYSASPAGALTETTPPSPPGNQSARTAPRT